MEIISYDRPREKMQQRGVEALTTSELLQIIIGSGTAGIPVTKIARKVDKALKVHGSSVKMDMLMSIPGLGSIKAGQIVAGIELSNRLAYQRDSDPVQVFDVLNDLYSDIRNAQKPTLLYAFFDAKGQLIEDYSIQVTPSSDMVFVVKKIFSQALAQSTHSIRLVIGWQAQLLEPSLLELNLARNAFHTSKLLAIPIRSIVLLSEKGEYIMKEVNYG